MAKLFKCSQLVRKLSGQFQFFAVMRIQGTQIFHGPEKLVSQTINS